MKDLLGKQALADVSTGADEVQRDLDSDPFGLLFTNAFDSARGTSYNDGLLMGASSDRVSSGVTS